MGEPTYRVIAEVIAAQIGSGALRPGDRLPAERTLVETWGVSRGTVKQALRELGRRGLVVQAQGSGTFVAGGGQSGGTGAVAAALVRRTVEQLAALQLTASEMDELFFTEAWARLPEDGRMTVAFVTDMPELAGTAAREIRDRCGLRAVPLPLAEVRTDPARLAEFELVAANAAYDQVVRLVSRERVARLVFDPSVDAMRALVALDGRADVAVGYESGSYLAFILRAMEQFCRPAALTPRTVEDWLASGRREGVLVLPPVEGEALSAWAEGWPGEALQLTWTLDKGSKTLLLEQARRVWERTDLAGLHDKIL